MNLDVFSVFIGIVGGGVVAWMIAASMNKNALNALSTQLALESEKLRAANEMLFETQKKLVEKSKALQEMNDEAISIKARLENAIETFRKQEADSGSLKTEIADKNELIRNHYGEIQQLKALNDGLNEKLSTLRKEIDETRKTFETEFKNMA